MNVRSSWIWLWMSVFIGTLCVEIVGTGTFDQNLWNVRTLYAQNAEPTTTSALTPNAILSLPTDATTNAVPASTLPNAEPSTTSTVQPPLFISGNDQPQAERLAVPSSVVPVPTVSPTVPTAVVSPNATNTASPSRFNSEQDATNVINDANAQNKSESNDTINKQFDPSSKNGSFENNSQNSENAHSVDSANQESLPMDSWTAPSGISRTLSGVMLITFFGLVPALVMMTTSFVRISVVLGMLRQAFGLPQIPPPQVLTSLAVFLTLAIMMPVWTQVYEVAVVPYSQSEIASTVAIERGVIPIRDFMIRQIDHSGNAEDIHLFLDRMSPEDAAKITTYEQVPLSILLPAFLLSELKTAFWIGFQICLPFLVIDLVVAAVLSAMGMLMVPPSTVSIPLKILLFVLADGWRLLAGSLLDTFF